MTRLCILPIVAFFLTGCTTDTTSTNNPPAASGGLMTYTEGGTTYTTAPHYKVFNVSGGTYATYATTTKQMSVIGGMAEGSPTRRLSVVTLDVTGAGAVDKNKSAVEYQIGNGFEAKEYHTDGSHHGTITYSKYDLAGKKVSGTFAVTAVQRYPIGATGTVTISNGSFTDVPVIEVF